MAKDQAEPLLHASRPSSDDSSERHVEEDDALLKDSTTRTSSRWNRYREIGLFAWALIATALVIILAVLYEHAESTTNNPPSDSPDNDHPTAPFAKRNLIFMVSDGMGPTSLSLTRSFLHQQESPDSPYNTTLVLDSHLIGTSRTRSTSSLITDSAAGATAFSCGLKSYNGAISVLPDGSPCGTVLEAAKRAGYMTGLVVTTRITDATPACFASHVERRDYEDTIAEQEVGLTHPLGRTVDLILGGGRCHFLPNSSEGSCRGDDTDVISLAQEKQGWHYASTRSDFDALGNGSNVQLPLLGLFASTDIPYEIDRRAQSDIYPSLTEMSRTALNALSAATGDSDKGFFLMIEGSRIDHAGHSNDPVAQVHEVLEYDRAFAAALAFASTKNNDDEGKAETIVISTSDHETGGLATARQLHTTYPDYHWFPSVLTNATHSSSYLSHQLREHVGSHVAASTDAMKTWIRNQLVEIGMGCYDATHEEINLLYSSAKGEEGSLPGTWLLADMVSRRSQVGWTTHGHSAVDVNVYASDWEGGRALRGSMENTDVGGFLRGWLDLDLGGITDDLKKALEGEESGWMGGKVEGESGEQGNEEGEDGREALDAYQGDFKRSKRSSCGCEDEFAAYHRVH
ncbi:MAG: vacuolar alkaline phosphatase [Ramalina farinacea]|uniref:Alkaline phosphatase n=1 Tax=Ramalina farinacea TaxID=258253 RepID=A0AA43TW30_9LECA|nr:vacuolar alkaline phosphatase [Ramalina farinacea]